MIELSGIVLVRSDFVCWYSLLLIIFSGKPGPSCEKTCLILDLFEE